MGPRAERPPTFRSNDFAECSELSAAEAQAGARVVERVSARGETPLERLISLVLLGDLVSLYLAILRGVDPTPVAVIEQLKTDLAARV